MSEQIPITPGDRERQEDTTRLDAYRDYLSAGARRMLWETMADGQRGYHVNQGFSHDLHVHIDTRTPRPRKVNVTLAMWASVLYLVGGMCLFMGAETIPGPDWLLWPGLGFMITGVGLFNYSIDSLYTWAKR